jgi:hypothetical protein
MLDPPFVDFIYAVLPMYNVSVNVISKADHRGVALPISILVVLLEKRIAKCKIGEFIMDGT